VLYQYAYVVVLSRDKSEGGGDPRDASTWPRPSTKRIQ
jgi:hypothetical protein